MDEIKAFLAVSFYWCFSLGYTLWLMWDERFWIGGRRVRLGDWVKARPRRIHSRARAMARLAIWIAARYMNRGKNAMLARSR